MCSVALGKQQPLWKRWHKGAVELCLGVSNPRDPEWAPPAGCKPTWSLPRHLRAFRDFHWHFVTKFAWLSTIVPPPIYTLVVVFCLWTNELFLYLNPLPTAAILLPRLFLNSFVATTSGPALSLRQYESGAKEYFVGCARQLHACPCPVKSLLAA